MYHLIIRLSIIFSSILLLSSVTYGEMVSTQANSKNQTLINRVNHMIEKKQSILLKTQKSDTAQFTSLYDDIAERTVSKNKLLLEIDRVKQQQRYPVVR